MTASQATAPTSKTAAPTQNAVSSKPHPALDVLGAFKNPGAEHRGAPFWSLNHDLTDHQRLRDQIDAFESMGLGGFHLHVRAGLKTEYLGEEFLKAILAAQQHGQSKGMLSYLYDEDTWPSGFAGGSVTTELEFRQRWLSLQRDKPELSAFCKHLCAYRIQLNSTGYLENYKRISVAEAQAEDWILSHHIAPNNDRFNGAAYLDVLNPKAVDAFIASTHQKYLDNFGGSFPKDVPSIFTDEPQMHRFNELDTAETGVALIPWTDDLPDTYYKAWQTNILDIFPEIIWPSQPVSNQSSPSKQRWQFWDHLSERFASAFADRIGDWCEAHGIASTGHMMAEGQLGSQMAYLGEAMRHYRSFQIPGIDILCNHYEPSTAKQAVSVARQDGRNGVMSELYGVTNWDFPFSGHKCQGDWQAALGITLRVHHLAWLSMEGQSKRDYPAAIGPQSPWFTEYRVVEDHFARVNVALKSGTAHVRVGLIHPIESAWLHRGVSNLDKGPFQQQQQSFSNCVNWLLDGQIDFDFIAESLLPQQFQSSNDQRLHVGQMVYDVIVLPQLYTIRSSTLRILNAFMQAGGSVIVLGAMPNLVDGAPAAQQTTTLATAPLVMMNEHSVLEALAAWRELNICYANGQRCALINHQIRRINDECILFCCHRKQEIESAPLWSGPKGKSFIHLRGHWDVYELHTQNGEETLCPSIHSENETIVEWLIEAHDHRLLRYKPSVKKTSAHLVPNSKKWATVANCPEATLVQREEENVLLLDIAEWRVDQEAWQSAQDSLVTQQQLAKRYQWPDWAQPYSVSDAGEKHRVNRRFQFENTVTLKNARLMCERMADTTIHLDGQQIDNSQPGHWIDRDLSTCALPDIPTGKHILEIGLSIDAVDRHLEWCYLLGDFHVETRGAHARIIPNCEQINWGDCVHQGLPFYGGNLDYQFTISIQEAGNYALRCPHFGGALLRVNCDERDCGAVAFAPYRAELGHLSVGEHQVKIRAYGNRHNTFGALHNISPTWHWWGPQSWRTSGEHQSDVWNFKPSGVLRAPILERLDHGEKISTDTLNELLKSTSTQ